MKTILLIAHGSRRISSNEEVVNLAKKMQSLLTDNTKVIPAFLELAKPSILEGIDLCVQFGANEIIVIPYFLSAGRHVIEDVPNEIAKGKGKYPHIKITTNDYLGNNPNIAQILIQQVLKR